MANKYRSVFNLLTAAVAATLVCSILLANTSLANPVDNNAGAITAADTHLEHNNNSRSLVYSGTTTRRMFFFKVYRISHFIENSIALPMQRNELVQHIMMGNYSQRIELEFLRDVTPKQVEKALIDGIERNNPERDLTYIKSEIARLSYGFDDEIKKNSVLCLKRGSNNSLTVIFNDVFIVETKNTELINALWSIWFGSDPIIKTDALISQLLTH